MRLPFLLLAFVAAGCGQGAGRPADTAAELRAPVLTPQQSGTTSRLQAVSPVDDRIVWVSGTGGTYAVTEDGGESWRAGVVPGADSLEFRDVEGVSERVAYLLAAGPGDRSRIYRTEDGGGSWALQFTNRDTSAFYDCFAFWTDRRGFTMSDGVAGRFPVVATADGQHWSDIGDRLPAAQTGEGAFAASGTCTATVGERHGWIVTGAGPASRVLATVDGGERWVAYPTPVVQGTSTTGGSSVAFRDTLHGILGRREHRRPRLVRRQRRAVGRRRAHVAPAQPGPRFPAGSTAWRTPEQAAGPWWPPGRAARPGRPTRAGAGRSSSRRRTTGP